MPQKFWEAGRTTKHLGWDDIAAMDELEMLEHLKEHFDITDIKPVDIQDSDLEKIYRNFKEEVAEQKISSQRGHILVAPHNYLV